MFKLSCAWRMMSSFTIFANAISSKYHCLAKLLVNILFMVLTHHCPTCYNDIIIPVSLNQMNLLPERHPDQPKERLSETQSFKTWSHWYCTELYHGEPTAHGITSALLSRDIASSHAMRLFSMPWSKRAYLAHTGVSHCTLKHFCRIVQT